MTKAEQFIQDYTNGCSNELAYEENDKKLYHEWVTPEQALAAVEISVNETADMFINWLKNNWRKYIDVDADGVVCFHHYEKDFYKMLHENNR